MSTRKIRHSAVIRWVLALLAALTACDAGEMEQPLQAGPPARPGPGQVLYITYCRSCHGESGRGDGPAADLLRTPPTDLTQLWMRHGTPLDRKAIAEYVDGRQLFSAHGAREMPVWGSEFFSDVPPDTLNLERVTERLIEVLVDHLETLQSEPQR